MPAYVPNAVPTAATPQALITTISSGGGTTTLTLTAAASTTVANKTVQHDDTAAIQAAVNGTVNGGGTVYLPKGTYNFFNLSLARLGSDTGNPVGWIVLKADGILSPMIPIVMSRGLYALVGGPQSSGNLSFHLQPYALIQHNNINPVIRVTSATANPILIRNIGINNCVGDGIAVDSGPTDITMENVNIAAHAASIGSPVRIGDNITAGFGFFLRDFSLAGATTTVQPSLHLRSAGQVYIENGTLIGRGIKDESNGLLAGNFGFSHFRNILTESLSDDAFLLIDSSQTGTFNNVLLSFISMSDNIASPTYLIRHNSGGVGYAQGIFVDSSVGFAAMTAGDPVALHARTAQGAGTLGSACTRCSLFTTTGNFNLNATGNSFGTAVGLTDVDNLFQSWNTATTAIVLKPLVGQSVPLMQWRDSANNVKAGADTTGRFGLTNAAGTLFNVLVSAPTANRTTTFQDATGTVPLLELAQTWTGAQTFNAAISTNSQFSSTLATGTAPFSVASTTPVANLTTVPNCGNAAGAQQTGCKIVFGTATLAAGTVTVNFTAPYQFTSGTSYVCTASDQTATAAAVGIGAKTATSVVFNGTGTDVIAYTCVGN